jgi:hypothetical protein
MTIVAVVALEDIPVDRLAVGLVDDVRRPRDEHAGGTEEGDEEGLDHGASG